MSANTDPNSKTDNLANEDCRPVPCSRLSDLLPPAEIVKAAERVMAWMEVNGYRNWQLSGICDRRIAADRDRLRDTLRTISVSDWKTSGELRCMARLAESSANTYSANT